MGQRGPRQTDLDDGPHRGLIPSSAQHQERGWTFSSSNRWREGSPARGRSDRSAATGFCENVRDESSLRGQQTHLTTLPPSGSIRGGCNIPPSPPTITQTRLAHRKRGFVVARSGPSARPGARPPMAVPGPRADPPVRDTARNTLFFWPRPVPCTQIPAGGRCVVPGRRRPDASTDGGEARMEPTESWSRTRR